MTPKLFGLLGRASRARTAAPAAARHTRTWKFSPGSWCCPSAGSEPGAGRLRIPSSTSVSTGRDPLRRPTSAPGPDPRPRGAHLDSLALLPRCTRGAGGLDWSPARAGAGERGGHGEVSSSPFPLLFPDVHLLPKTLTRGWRGQRGGGVTCRAASPAVGDVCVCVCACVAGCVCVCVGGVPPFRSEQVVLQRERPVVAAARGCGARGRAAVAPAAVLRRRVRLATHGAGRWGLSGARSEPPRTGVRGPAGRSARPGVPRGYGPRWALPALTRFPRPRRLRSPGSEPRLRGRARGLTRPGSGPTARAARAGAGRVRHYHARRPPLRLQLSGSRLSGPAQPGRCWRLPRRFPAWNCATAGCTAWCFAWGLPSSRRWGIRVAS